MNKLKKHWECAHPHHAAQINTNCGLHPPNSNHMLLVTTLPIFAENVIKIHSSQVIMLHKQTDKCQQKHTITSLTEVIMSPARIHIRLVTSDDLYYD